MKQAFDASFAKPVEVDEQQGLPALVVSVGASRWILRLRDIIGVARARPPLAVPGGAPALLGLTGVRGSLVPVYSLAMLLGLAEAPRGDALWLALVAHGGTLGLAFDALLQHAQLRADRVHFGADGTAVGQLEDEPVPIVDMATVLAAITRAR